MLHLELSQPQLKHLQRTMDGLIAYESTKTLCAISRLHWEAPDPSNLADFFRDSPWDENAFRHDVQIALLGWALRSCHERRVEPQVLVSIDDSMAPKPKTSRHLEAADWHHDGTGKGLYAHGASFLTVHLRIGDVSFPWNWRIYLRERTVRRINKQRTSSRRLRFQSKMVLAKSMVQELSQQLPPGLSVYVLFDSWYASKRLIHSVRSKHWHVICALKSNRVWKGKRLALHARYLRNQSLTRIHLGSAHSASTYWVCVKQGRLKGLSEEALILFSKRHLRDKRPAYFLSTDRSLSAKQVLALYSTRWDVEVDHFYLKTRLGLADFRMRSLEATAKYFSVVFVTLAYLHWRHHTAGHRSAETLADVLARHRHDQWRTTLQDFGERVLKKRKVAPVIQQFLLAA